MHRFAVAVGLVLLTGPAVAGQLPIVAAERVYGDVASQIAGPDAAVQSILQNPSQDPHLFEASPSVARAVSAARIAVQNGADYDPWMARLLSAARNPARETIDIAALLHRKPGDNPHLWYDPAAMPAFAHALTAALARADPAHAVAFTAGLAAFSASLEKLTARIADMRARHAGVAITATEPVFGLMAQALGLTMRNERFQLAAMNGAEPRASDIAAFEADLRRHAVRALLVNGQVTSAAAAHLAALARTSGIPVVSVTETLPPGATYQSWMMAELAALDGALNQNSPP